MIEVRNLVKQYGDHIAVDHLNFTVEKGQVCGFLGPNGAGKSTTMNIMTGYLSPTSGEVIINGYNILDEPEKAKRCIGYLPEIPPLYTEMTVGEYLRFAAELKGVSKKDIQSEIDRVVERTHLKEMYNRLTGNLSKGYRQRVGVAQAIIGSPEIIILDEPTIGLDPKQIIEIRELIRDLAKEHTIILSSHILFEVQEVCDRMLIIDHGKLLANGSPEELEREIGSSSMEVTVKHENPDYVRSTMEKMKNIGNIEIESSGKNELSVRFKVNNGADMREEVFYTCVKADLPILNMKANEFSLEHIFLELTSQKKKIVPKKQKAVKAPTKNETEAN